MNKKSHIPLLTMGMPVYNAENYIEEALSSIIKQSFKDFKLIISDNGSTDKTQKICEKYVRKDKRITYIRHNKNMGAAWNFNYVVNISNSKYFKWAAHDDNLHKDFLKKCINILENDPTIIVAYTKARIIDGKGKLTELYSDKLNSESSSVSERYKKYHQAFTGHYWCNSVFGVIRSDVLKKTNLIGTYISSDVTLLGELALRGKMFEIPEYLFDQRIHPQNPTQSTHTTDEKVSWFDPSKSGKLILTNWRHLVEHFKSINKISMSCKERILCYFELKKWCWRNKRKLIREIITFFMWPIAKLLSNKKN